MSGNERLAMTPAIWVSRAVLVRARARDSCYSLPAHPVPPIFIENRGVPKGREGLRPGICPSILPSRMDASTLKAQTRKMILAEPQKSVETTTTRNPLFLFLLSGLFLLR